MTDGLQDVCNRKDLQPKTLGWTATVPKTTISACAYMHATEVVNASYLGCRARFLKSQCSGLPECIASGKLHKATSILYCACDVQAPIIGVV